MHFVRWVLKKRRKGVDSEDVGIASQEEVNGGKVMWGDEKKNCGKWRLRVSESTTGITEKCSFLRPPSCR